MKYGNIREEELKMRVGQDWFSPYDTTHVQRELTGYTLGTFFTLKCWWVTIFAGSGMHTRHWCTRYF